ncbi:MULTISPECIES: hypothetical protein [Thermomonosporaceae]|uniref:hypothetical protein n=1 Tax=Thermomonosporaceae TaxID=2012 RepID=UPI00255B0F3C|nr:MULTISPECIES: hypothetical protein [Thermomonosporaceae]MDL4777219.1 hypothetical protein [Actinomadura xylanilytica]
MRVRLRPSLPAAVAAGTVVLVLAGCGSGGEKDPAPAAEGGSAAPARLAPLPEVPAAQVKPLTGRWVGTAKDHFQFKADGSGVWMKGGQTLWSGKAIPEGKDRFRFSWEGGDPQTASYWGATLTDHGAKLLFAGTNQPYTKVRQHTKGKG